MKLNLLCVATLVSFVFSRELPYCDFAKLKFRRNLDKLSDAKFDSYVNAINKLRTTSHSNKYDELVKTYSDHYTQFTSMPQFLIWNRMFLYELENLVNSVDNSVILNYWDFTLKSDDPRSDLVFSNNKFGGLGNRFDSYCVRDSRFTDNAGYHFGDGSPSQSHCITRTASLADQKFPSFDDVDKGLLKIEQIGWFINHMQVLIHSKVAHTVGGEFETSSALNDPLFISHLVFIDKLWFDWQNKNVAKSADYPMSLNTLLKPWDVKVKIVIDPLDRLCYAYKQDRFMWN